MSVVVREQALLSRPAQRLRSFGWESVVRVVAPLTAFALEGWAALIGAVLVQEIGLWLSRQLAEACRRQFAGRLFLAAYAVRMAIGIPTHYFEKLANGNGALFPDNYTNDLVGEWLVRIAHGDGTVSIFAGHQYLLGSAYSYLLMAVYEAFGYAPLLPKLLNMGMSAVCSVLTYEIARELFSRRASLLAALGTVVLPTLVVWSIASIKETLVLFAALLALWILQRLTRIRWRESHAVTLLVVLCGLLLLLIDLRATTAFMLLALLGLAAVAQQRVNLRMWQLTAAGLVVLGLLVGSLVVVRVRTSNRPLTATFEDIALQIRHRRAQEAAGAASQLRSATEVLSPTGSQLPVVAEQVSDDTPFSFVGDVLDPLAYALLAPAPWQAQSQSELAASAEMPVWYLLLAASFLAWPAARRPRLFLSVVLAYAIANWLILAAVEGNVGNLLRHRLTLDPVLLILGAAGLEYAWCRWRGLSGRGSAPATG